MPYIPQEQRQALPHPSEMTEGQLNYRITTMLDAYISNGMSYARINAAIGVLECAKLELYRRIAARYEDTKRLENGDVYNPELMR